MPGMNVFIYGGAGALGQAAISIALAHGCQVFTTVNDVRKKRFLKKLFPQLKDLHIGNSRDDAFQSVVKNATKGEGCDIFLSCAKGNLKKRYFSCIALNGNIIDTAQLVSRENIEFEYRFLARQVSYHAVDFSSIFDEGKTLEIKKLQIMLSEGIIRGYVRPLSRVTYEPYETPRAFRLLTASRHRGRVLLSLKEKTLVVEPRISCHPSSSYVVVYNDEMLGLRVAELLVERGATNLFIHGEQTSYLHYKIETWKKRGVRVKVSSANLVIKEEAMDFLKYSNSVGGIDGIYVVFSNLGNNQKAVASILSNLDSVSRQLCPNLRHFALISENDKSWREILSKRAHDGYPALSLQMHLKKYIDSEEINSQTPSSDSSLALHSAIRAIEKALYSKDTIVQAFAQKIVPRNILEEVAKIPGVNITNATVDRTSLEQVGVDQGRAQELCYLLEDKFQITISPADVPQMTIGQLKQLKVETEDLEKEVPGFGAYLNVFDEKALEATANIIVLPTLVQRDECKLEDFHANFEYLCIVPGLDGHHGRFRSLCERLKISAAVLQPGNQYPQETVTETAQRMAKVIMQYMKPKKGYNILGYEYGVLVALEIAAILENYGYTGTLYMVGGTPEDIRTSFNEQWKDYDDNAMQNELLRHMHTLITQTTSPDLEGILQKAKTWSEKFDSLIADLKNKVPHSIQYMRSTIEVIYSRIKQLQNYSIQPQKLKSKVVLLQAKPYRSSLESLKPYSHQEPSLIKLRAKLHLAHKDLSCSNIINRYLHPEILEEYEKSNHCVKLYVTVEEKLKMIGVKITRNES
ncbi:fatty acid synthase-like [Ostrinia nubilalis]|uniref:fatty acid synthase-like n=1 Tax=Ostrinia nubilalis TaxID=29057 RepID=UPI0030823CB4